MNQLKQDYQFVDLHRARLNLLDMIGTVGRDSIPATLFYDIDMSWCENLIAQLAEMGNKITITALLIKAIAIAQINHPASRTVMLPNKRLVQFNNISAQFTVERFVENQPALFFGEIENPVSKSLRQISAELKAYGSEPFDSLPKLQLEDRFSRFPGWLRALVIHLGIRVPSFRLRYMGATFGLSSLGKYGCRNLISPSVITSMFCVGELEPRPVAIEGRVEIKPQLSLVLNFDHRVMDGAVAARFMQEVVQLLQGGLESAVHGDFLDNC